MNPTEFPVGTKIIITRNGQFCPNAEYAAMKMGLTKWVKGYDIESDTMGKDWRLTTPVQATIIAYCDGNVGIEDQYGYNIVMHIGAKLGRDFELYKMPVVKLDEELFTL